MGMSGKPFELGVPACAVEDGNGFVLGRGIMWKGGDAHIAIPPLIKRCREAFPDLRACSFDRGFYSPSNREQLDDPLEVNALPKKGKPSSAERGQDFMAARRKNSGVESVIDKLEHRGTDRIRLRGPTRFELAVGLSVLAFNIQRTRTIPCEKERKRMRRRRCIPFFGASLSCWLGCQPGSAFRGLQTRLQSSGGSGSGAAVEDL